MNSRQIYLSGELVPEADAKISIFDSAVMLGDSITESTRTFGHSPFRLTDHIRRLFRSLKVARIDCGHTPQEIRLRGDRPHDGQLGDEGGRFI